MTRRLCLFTLAASPSLFIKGAGAALLPLDEQAFRSIIAAHRGKVLLVDFWATWCSSCREELPKLVALHFSLRAKGFTLVTISCDDPEQMTDAASIVERQGAPGPYYIKRAQNDDAFINAIDPKWSGALPALFLFDRNGNKVRSFIGESDMRQLKTAIDNLL